MGCSHTILGKKHLYLFCLVYDFRLSKNPTVLALITFGIKK